MLEFRVLELLINMLEIFPAFPPVVDLVEWTTILILLLTIRIGHNLLDLPLPLYDNTIKSLDEILVLAVTC